MNNRIVSVIAQCTQCRWSCEDYRNSVAVLAAHRHAKIAGHDVTIQTTTSRTIKGKAGKGAL